ncbi:Gfo/Idh/MocA family protein [Phaeodactylibacter xiamenensis]|uniref:Gfo/Idh/MocA family protein n=1 Tax=Phaeodactylibacter xiamenensis TaxID=1524460 RepID=UPI0024A9C66E|nr:Gfo/Idh/MocA family oxidoreductase [Phaeodactylibacter xiamenensis]
MTTEKSFQIGVIGAGMIAENHIQNLQKSSRATVTWVAATTMEKALKVGKQYNIPQPTARYQYMLEDPALDAVIICTPPFLHAEMAAAALSAGKHVLVEKPLTLTYEEATSLLEHKRQYPNLIAMDCSARHARLHPKYQTVKRYIESGALGDIYYVHHNAVSQQSRPGIEYHPSAKWFLDKEKAGGGPLFDWGVYDLSFHLGVLGDRHELQRVDAIQMAAGLDSRDPGSYIYNVEEHFSANLTFSGGLRYYWERAAHANMQVPNETRIYGTRGGLKLAFCSWDAPELNLYGLNESGDAFQRKESLDYQDQDDGYAMALHFLDCLEGKTEPIQSLEVAASHLQIIHQCYQFYQNQ